MSAFEESGIVTQKLRELRAPSVAENTGRQVAGSDLSDYGQAPEFTGISTWLNTENSTPLTLHEDLKGKVVLIDFWTYSCINCIRTLPYLREWQEKYKDAGFTVVGVHTPEFLFEHKTSNVEEALKKYQLSYPVAQDNEYATWQAYENRYWPAHYLIDVEGRIRYTHFGEGEYEKTEAAIQELLNEAGKTTGEGFVRVEAEAGGSGTQTRETYLGFTRMERFQSDPYPTALGEQTFVLSKPLPVHNWGYKGTWNIEKERGVAGAGAALQFHIRAQKVFLVMGPVAGAASTTVEVWLDGKPMDAAVAGSDVKNGKVLVQEERLYELLNADRSEGHSLELLFPDGSTAVYAFTFS